ncbi:hypothetical protein JAAARDRAFT_124269 [Jaapia argillacea MUCL 33604]|uniref:Ribosomal protein S21 n=1 Tax=Jaapia argillacea MUCL 33604 TaxID=933084 RepID=A0A067Q3X8_9AGAM|nr:hypothetical protein JAAARDRAFT_124269 [Jaapia argillacea MUCL 33604]
MGTGRSVKVVKGAVDEAYFKLIQIIKRNNVVGELRLAKRHEKRGVKRRRLESKRWRTQFANEVRKKVQLVNEIRKQGA